MYVIAQEYQEILWDLVTKWLWVDYPRFKLILVCYVDSRSNSLFCVSQNIKVGQPLLLFLIPPKFVIFNYDDMFISTSFIFTIV